MRVAVIGGGPAGLGVVKELKDEDLDPVCYEKTDDIGGLWKYRDQDLDGTASVMKSTIINTSKELGANSQCPPPAHFPNYMHNTLMYEYIRMLAEEGDVLRHVVFNQETVSICKHETYEETGRWTVTNRNTLNGELTSDVFDCVCICIGHHVYPNIPTLPNQDEFQGQIMHTHSLKSAKAFEDKTVVVVGVGNSGMDAAVELSSVTKQVYLSSRRGAWVLPRVGPKGHPFDALFLRRKFHILQSFLPYSWICNPAEKLINDRFNHSLYNLKPKHRIWSQHPTVSDTLPIKLLSGTVLIRGAINACTKKGVIFDGEEKEIQADAIILATGYQIKFPFLQDDIIPVQNNKVNLYKFIFPPDLPHPSLAVVGLIQPNGPGFPVGEMQCRWVARVFSGKIKLPSAAEMHKDIRKKLEFNRKRFVDSPRHTLQVDFIGYQDELAKEIGCKPDLLKLAFTDWKLFKALLTGPSLPYQYRLQGPHSWDGAREAILTYKKRVVAPLQRPGRVYTMPKRSGKMKIIFVLCFVFILYKFFLSKPGY